MAMMAALVQEDRVARRQERAEDNQRFLDAVDVAVSGAREQMELHLHRVESALTQRQDQLGRDLADGLVATQVGLHAHVDAAQAEQQQQLVAIMERLEALEQRHGHGMLGEGTGCVEASRFDPQVRDASEGAGRGLGGVGVERGEFQGERRVGGVGVRVSEQQQKPRRRTPPEDRLATTEFCSTRG
jgi:hypothetical protein